MSAVATISSTCCCCANRLHSCFALKLCEEERGERARAAGGAAKLLIMVHIGTFLYTHCFCLSWMVRRIDVKWWWWWWWWWLTSFRFLLLGSQQLAFWTWKDSQTYYKDAFDCWDRSIDMRAAVSLPPDWRGSILFLFSVCVCVCVGSETLSGQTLKCAYCLEEGLLLYWHGTEIVAFIL